MASQKQLAANRANSLKSTGPRTEAGKSITRMNALKTGLHAETSVIPGEDPETFAALTADYYAEYHPTTPPARALVDDLIRNEWLLRRLQRVETELWHERFEALADYDDFDEETAAGEAYIHRQETLTRLQRRIDSAGRAFHRALRDLERLQRDTPRPSVAAEIGFVPSATLPTVPPAHSRSAGPEPRPPAYEIGFVPSSVAQAPPVHNPRPPAHDAGPSNWLRSVNSSASLAAIHRPLAPQFNRCPPDFAA